MAFDITKHEQTGRTERMLKHAIELSQKGRAVYVMGINATHAQMLHRMCVEQLDVENHGIQFETPETLSNFNWERMELEHAHPNSVVLVDHSVIEHKFYTMLQMLHRFDASVILRGSKDSTNQTDKGDTQYHPV
jgi:hypothetical protein